MLTQNVYEAIKRFQSYFLRDIVPAAMSPDRFKMMLKFIIFDNESNHAERAKTDKAAPIRDIWIIQNRNLEKAYKQAL